MKKSIGIIALYGVVMIMWTLLPPLALIGGVIRETGEKITSYAMSLGYWVNCGFTKPLIWLCVAVILYEILIIATKLYKNAMKENK